MLLRGHFAFLCVVGAAVAVGGCKGEEAPPANYANGGYQQQPGGYQQQPGGYQQQPGGYQQQPGGYQQQPGGYQQPGGTGTYTPPAGTTAPGTTPAPAETGSIFGIPLPPGFQLPGAPATGTPATGTPGAAPAGGTTASPVDPTYASAAAVPLQAYASQEAAGMAADGGASAAQFQAGQVQEVAFSLQPGRCYAVVAGGAGIGGMNLAIQLATPVPGLNPTLAQAAVSGAQGSVGGRGNCYKSLSPFAVNAKYVVTATAGSGIIASQLYSK